MKKIFCLIFGILLLVSCTQKNTYVIKVNATGEPDSIMIHNNWYSGADTAILIDGQCEFTGEIDTFPKLVSLGFPYPSQERTRMILEPGKIEVKYSAENGFILGGTKNNIILQKLFDELKPYDEEVTKTWKAWGEAYRKEPRDNEECEETWIVQEEAKKLRNEKTRELIKTNPNYAGLVIALPIARYETAEMLKSYVDGFKEFSYDKRFESLKDQYEVAAKTTGGAPVPDFTFPDPDGKMVSLTDFRGKWVLIDFWYVDCHWCRKMTPHLITIYEDWKDKKNFEIVSISVDKPKDYDRWKQAIIDDGATWTQVLDSTKTYPLEYGVTGYPTMFLVDPEGKGTIKIIGYQEEGGLRRLLEEIMK
ncbi:redoxin domain-containing protein [Bacteroidota bacterium]